MDIQSIFDKIKSNPKLAYGIITSILVLVLVGYIRRWKWAIDPTGNRKSMILVEWFGYENYRKIMILLLSIGIITLIFLLFI